MDKRLNLPHAELPIRNSTSLGARQEIFDPLRGKWVTLTPEERVRQLFIHWLMESRGYRKHRMASEMTITLNGMSRRCDAVVFDPAGRRPVAIIEFKAPSVKITADVFAQAARYNIVLETPVLIVSNGINHYCAVIPPSGPPQFLESIPDYETLLAYSTAAPST